MVEVEQLSSELPTKAVRGLCVDKSIAYAVQGLYNYATGVIGLPIVFNNAYRDRATAGTGGRPGSGDRSQHMSGFAFDINVRSLTATQVSLFTDIAASWGFVPVANDPGHYQARERDIAIFGTHGRAVEEARRSYRAGECVDANVEAVRAGN